MVRSVRVQLLSIVALSACHPQYQSCPAFEPAPDAFADSDREDKVGPVCLEDVEQPTAVESIATDVVADGGMLRGPDGVLVQIPPDVACDASITFVITRIKERPCTFKAVSHVYHIFPIGLFPPEAGFWIPYTESLVTGDEENLTIWRSLRHDGDWEQADWGWVDADKDKAGLRTMHVLPFCCVGEPMATP